MGLGFCGSPRFSDKLQFSASESFAEKAGVTTDEASDKSTISFCVSKLRCARFCCGIRIVNLFRDWNFVTSRLHELHQPRELAIERAFNMNWNFW